MKRDMDLVRQMLLALEAGPGSVSGADKLGIVGRERGELWHHLTILEDAGFVGRDTITVTRGSAFFGDVSERKGGYRLTWSGHEFLDSIRDPEVWRKTKEGASRMGGASVEFVWQIAKAYGRQKAKDLLGIDLA